MSDPPVTLWKKLRPVRRAAGALIAFALFGFALLALHKTLAGSGLEEIKGAVRATDPIRIAAAIGSSLVGYGVLTLYDRLALSWIGKPLPARIVVPTAFIAYAMSHNLGFNLLTGTSVRYRMYTRNGLSPLDVGRLVFFASTTLWLGFGLLASLVLLAAPPGLTAAIHVPESLARPAGLIGVVGVVAYLVLCRFLRRELVVRGATFALPRLALAVRQLVVSAADWLVAATTLFILMPKGGGVTLWLLVIAAYLLASVASLISHVPGGVGVLEATVFLMLSPVLPQAEILAALVVFRAAYFFVPFGIALVGLVVVEASSGRAGLARVLERLVAPPVVAGAVFLAGVVLLAIVSTPSSVARLAVVEGALPELVLEVAHVAGGVLAALLLAAARGLVWRHGGAHRAASVAVALGGMIAVVVGLKFGLAFVLALVLLAGAGTRSSFARRGGILGGRANASFIAAVVVCWVLCAFLFVLSYDVDQGAALLRAHDEAGRSARALAAAGATTLLLLAARRLRQRPARLAPGIVHALEVDGATLRFAVGDRAFVALGSPSGDEAARRELFFRFVELCDDHGVRCTVQDIGPDDLPLVVDAGLVPIAPEEGRRIPFVQSVA